MKRGFKLLITSLLLVLMSSQVCLAAEKQDMADKMPERIEIEGGVLELVNAPIVTSVQGSARYQYVVKTDGSNLNVRSGPGTNYSIVGKFANGAVVNIPYMQPSDSTRIWNWAFGNDADTGKRIEGYINVNYVE